MARQSEVKVKLDATELIQFMESLTAIAAKLKEVDAKLDLMLHPPSGLVPLADMPLDQPGTKYVHPREHFRYCGDPNH